MDESAREAERAPNAPGWMLAVAGAMLAWTIFSAHAAEPGAAELAARIPTGFPGQNEPLDLNRASPRELRQLPGIGPSRAVAIVRSRWGDGAFAAPAELDRIPGIGPQTTRRVWQFLAAQRARAEARGRVNGGP